MAGRRKQYRQASKLNLSIEESLKSYLDERASEEGISMATYVQRLIRADQNHQSHILLEDPPKPYSATPPHPPLRPAHIQAAPAQPNVITPTSSKSAGGGKKPSKKTSTSYRTGT